MLRMTQAQLAKRAKISVTGLNNIERGKTDPRASTLRAIQSVLEAAGVKFINGTEEGVSLTKRVEQGRRPPTGRRSRDITRK